MLDKRYSFLQIFLKYCAFRYQALNAHGLHSPFVYELYTKIIRGRTQDEHFRKMRRFHAEMAASRQPIHYNEFKEGVTRIHTLTIGKMIRRFGVSPRNGGLLFRLAARFSPEIMLELGSSLGVSSMYLAAAQPNARLITLEACPESALQAAIHHQQAGIRNIRIINTLFDEGLQEVLDSLPRLDLVYLDGNHRYEPTIRYYNMIKPLLHPQSLVILDDIHYSPGMEKAWKEICSDEKVSASVELFHFGLLFYREGMVKQHFRVRA